MLRSPMAEESAYDRVEAGMARSATRAPRSAGCSYARELMSGNRMRPRRAGRDSVVMPAAYVGFGVRSAHLEDPPISPMVSWSMNPSTSHAAPMMMPASALLFWKPARRDWI